MENAIAEHLALPPPVVLALFQRSGAHTTSVASGMGAGVPNSPHWRNIWTAPVVDALGLIMRDPSGSGGCVCVGLHETTKLDRRRAALLAKVSMHMAAGMRLRASVLDVERADAVLSSSGKVLHATERSPGAESSLHEGYRRRRVARKTKHDAEKALEIWQGLVAGRWSLVDFIDTDGKRLVLAMKNAPRVDRRSDLTPNERRVAALAAMGHRDKEIAYMLGLSPSAVTAALRRARGKLNVSTRADLARVWRQDGELPSSAFAIDGSERSC
ncbi:MAG: LuxR C-terminal-related transcriptional regulator [Polyangiaceae bacterium]